MSQTKVKSGLLNFPDQTDFVKLPSGTTAQRPSSPEEGYSRYNTTDNKLEFWDGTEWQQLPGVVAPIITSISYPGDDLAADPAGGQTITINGSDFKADATVTVDGTTPSVITFVSATEITFTAPAKAAGDYNIVVTNVDGGNATAVDGMTYNGLPSWTTSAGNLGTFAAGSTIPTITLVATEPDSGVVSYSVTTGALPTGLTLTGADIDGTVPTPAGQTTYNFSVTASDDENQESTERAFNIVVYLQVTNTVSEVDPFGDSSGVVLYRFENNANDEGGVYNGTATSVTYGTGVFGQSSVFNGSNSFISLPSILNIDSQRVTFSVSLWLKINTPKVAGIFNDYSGTGGYNMIFEGQSNGTVRIFNNFGAGVAMDTPNLNDSSWHNVIVMNDAVNNIQYLYVDGYFHNSQVLNTGTKVNTSGIFIGKYNIAGDYFFDGDLDQIRIFNRVLDPLEIESLYSERTVLCGGQSDTLDILGDNSCIATYQLNSNANDLSGNYSGTPTNVSYGVGEFDLAGVFNGSSSYVLLNGINTAGFAPTEYSVSAWFKTSSSNVSIFSTDAGGNPISTRTRIHVNSSGQIEYEPLTISSKITSPVVVNDGNWHFVLVSTDSSGNTKLYVDGNSAVSGSGGSINFRVETWIGCSDATVYSTIGRTNFFNGSIDQVRIFNKALSAGEVTTLYNETACDLVQRNNGATQILGDSSCISYLKLDGNATDETGNYTTSVTNVDYGVGEFGQAGYFNQVYSSRIEYNAAILPADVFSVSMWMKVTVLTSNKWILTQYTGGVAGRFVFAYNDNGTLQISNGTSNSGASITEGAIRNNIWQHIVLIKNGSSGWEIYVDNRSIGTWSNTSNIITNQNTVFSGNQNVTTQSIDGQLDNIRVFNKAISASEVTTLYNEGI